MDKTACTEVHDLYSSTNNARMITSKGIRWVGLEACKEKKGGTYRVLVVKHIDIDICVNCKWVATR